MTPQQRSWLTWLEGRPFERIEHRRRAARSCMVAGWTEWVVKLSDGSIAKWPDAGAASDPIGERITEGGRQALARAKGGER